MFYSYKYPGSNTEFRNEGKANLEVNMERASGAYHVLVVHHHPDTLHMMAAMFLKFGYQVTTAGDSARALISFGRRPFDLLFADLEMPMLDGYHLAWQIKKRSPQTKVVLMTCRCQAELVDFMKDDTVDGWLFKPFNTNAFRKTLIGIGLSAQPEIVASL